MAEQQHWYAATEDGGIVEDGPRKKDVLAALDARHDWPGFTSRIRSGLYTVAFPQADTIYFLANETQARVEGWNP
jgi:hypothetical protein